MAGRRGPVAPRLLDPLLALVESIDRRVRRITPIQQGGVLAVERHRYRGQAMRLADGTAVRAGDRADIIHFVNSRLRELADVSWQTDALAQARDDLRVLAARLGAQPASRPVAYRGATVLAPFARRFGFEELPRTRSVWHRVEDWYIRSMLARWSPAGRLRLRTGHSGLGVSEVWISASRLIERYGRGEDASDQ